MSPKLSSNPHFPFLSLPRELRDEIYNHLLIQPTPPPLNPPISASNGNSNGNGNNSNGNAFAYALHYDDPEPKPFKLVTLGLLRVNRQIHDEAVQVLYGKNEFLIKVRIDEYIFMPRLWVPGFQVRWMTPWEDLVYYVQTGIGAKKVGIYKPITLEPTTIGRLLFTSYTNTPPSTPHFPPPHYGRLIKRLLIIITDIQNRTMIGRYESERLCSVMLPFSRRLSKILGSEKEVQDRGVKIKVKVLVKGASVSEVEGGWAEGAGGGVRVGEYREIMQLLWPLGLVGGRGADGSGRRGSGGSDGSDGVGEGWRLETMVDEAFPGEREKCLRECDEMFGQAEFGEFDNVQLDEGCHWATMSGRVVVQADEALLE